MNGVTTLDKVVFVLFGAAIFSAGLSSWMLGPERHADIYAEGGPIEWFSVCGWVGAAVFVPCVVRPLGIRAVSFALLSLAFAAREADWQKKFTTDGALKINYYENASIPFVERMTAGLIVLVLLSGLLYAVFVSVRFLFFYRGWNTRSGAWILVTGGCLVLGKTLDRFPAELRNLFDFEMSRSVVRVFGGIEETVEALAVVAFVVSVWISRNGRSYLRPGDDFHPKVEKPGSPPAPPQSDRTALFPVGAGLLVA